MKKYRVIIVSDDDTNAGELRSSICYGWNIKSSYPLEDGEVAFILEKEVVDEELVEALKFIEEELINVTH
jgi:hypothetical protein